MMRFVPLAACVGALLSGCFNPSYHDTGLRCDSNGGKCPNGYHCAADKSCWRIGFDPDMASVQPPPEQLGDIATQSPIDMAGPGTGHLGEACKVDGDCIDGHCADGVCCNMACGGCNVCNSPTTPGQCVPAATGADPHGTCTNTVCAKGCDGKGSCAPAPSTTLCKFTCTNQVSTSDQSLCTQAQCGYAQGITQYCDGATVGTCVGSGSGGACAKSLICASATECKQSCVHDADCVAGYYCGNGNCLAKLANNASCSQDNQCATGMCNGGKCVSCKSLMDCNAYQGVCGASGTCGTCTKDADCYIGGYVGNGSSCMNGTCVCSINPDGIAYDCTSPVNPVGIPGGMGPPVCGCGTTPILASSRPNVVCSSASGSSGVPVKVAGQPCFANSECASNACNNNVCAKAPKGTLCKSAADCQSGNCTTDLTVNHGALSCK